MKARREPRANGCAPQFCSEQRGSDVPAHADGMLIEPLHAQEAVLHLQRAIDGDVRVMFPGTLEPGPAAVKDHEIAAGELSPESADKAAHRYTGPLYEHAAAPEWSSGKRTSLTDRLGRVLLHGTEAFIRLLKTAPAK